MINDYEKEFNRVLLKDKTYFSDFYTLSINNLNHKYKLNGK